MKQRKRVLAGYDLDIEVSTIKLLSSLDKIAKDNPELSDFEIEDDVYISNSTYYNVYGYREETDLEMEVRIHDDKARTERDLAHKRWQLNKLKEELGED
jgi:hypothetical protein